MKTKCPQSRRDHVEGGQEGLTPTWVVKGSPVQGVSWARGEGACTGEGGGSHSRDWRAYPNRVFIPSWTEPQRECQQHGRDWRSGGEGPIAVPVSPPSVDTPQPDG